MLKLRISEHKELLDGMEKHLSRYPIIGSWKEGSVYVKGFGWRFIPSGSEGYNMPLSWDMTGGGIGKEVLHYVKKYYPEELL